MNKDNDIYKDANMQHFWFREERERVVSYLERERIRHGGVAEHPDWYAAPYVALWRIQSRIDPSQTGWWVISGDLPCDYCSAGDVPEVRSALRHFVRKWEELSRQMIAGKAHSEYLLGDPQDWLRQGELLGRRSQILCRWAEDDRLWE